MKHTIFILKLLIHKTYITCLCHPSHACHFERDLGFFLEPVRSCTVCVFVDHRFLYRISVVHSGPNGRASRAVARGANPQRALRRPWNNKKYGDSKHVHTLETISPKTNRIFGMRHEKLPPALF